MRFRISFPFSPQEILGLADYKKLKEREMIRVISPKGHRFHAKINGNEIDLHFDRSQTEKILGLEYKYHSSAPKDIVKGEARRILKIYWNPNTKIGVNNNE